MTRNLGICITVLIAMLIVSGCVSTGKYEKMEMGKNQEIAAIFFSVLQTASYSRIISRC